MPTRGASERYALDEQQVASILAQPQDLNDRVALKLMLFLGMRVAEVVHLNSTWIHGNEIHIPPSMKCLCKECVEHSRHPGEWRPKSSAGARTLPIPDSLEKDFYQFIELHPGGIKVTRQALWWKVKQWAKGAKIHVKGLAEDTIYPHVLRASAATRMASYLTAPELCYAMGWSNISMGEHYISIVRSKVGAGVKIREMYK